MGHTALWNPMQKRLRETIRKEDAFAETKTLLLHMHALLHEGALGAGEGSLLSAALEGVTQEAAQIMPTQKDVTILWDLWHITRIEDLTVNLLVLGGGQVLGGDWLKRLGTTVTDTGNAMTDEEIIALSRQTDLSALRAYRLAVGKRTQEAIKALAFADLKRGFSSENIERLVLEGGLTPHPNSIWLKGFWGGKDVAGILLMPVTRHQVGHIGDIENLKLSIRRKSAYYMG